MLFNAKMSLAVIVFFPFAPAILCIAGATSYTTPGLTRAALTVATNNATAPGRNAADLQFLVGQWDAVAIGMNSSSSSGRRVHLHITEVSADKKKAKGTYIRGPYERIPGDVGGQNEVVADIITRDGDLILKWIGDSADSRAEFELKMKGGKLIGTRIEGRQWHQFEFAKK